jgi:hypothetical protein
MAGYVNLCLVAHSIFLVVAANNGGTSKTVVVLSLVPPVYVEPDLPLSSFSQTIL